MMKSKFLNSKTLRILSIMFIVICNVMTVFGQGVNNTKIKDGSVASSDIQAHANALLELESNSKGFLLPRMTSAQRDAINISDKDKGNGLVIYNIQSDCVNYWSKSAKKWLSLCGEVPPAVVDLLNCDKILLSASGVTNLTQGKSLLPSDILYVSVDVKEAGSFSITALTTNGYSFSKSGVFETAGIYTVALEGLGTPLDGNDTIGDSVSFSLNGNVSTKCPDFKIKVKSTIIDFEVKTLGKVLVTWDAFIGVPLTAAKNTFSINVDVKTIGYWRIQTNTGNGMSFYGTGEFTQLGLQKIEIVGQGIPQTPTEGMTPSEFTIKTNSKNASTPNLTIQVHVKAAGYELVCNNPEKKAELRGEYVQGIKLNKSHSLLVPIKVLAPGVVTLRAMGVFTIPGVNAVAIEFIGENIQLSFNDSQANIQFVTLYAKETETIPKGANKLSFTEINPGTKAVCTDFPTKDVNVQRAQYGFYCNTANFIGNYEAQDFTPTNNPNSDLNDGQHFLDIKVNVGTLSEYSIETNDVEGVKFRGSGTFTKLGSQTVRLTASGPVFKVGGSKVFTITSDSTEGIAACTAILNVSYRDIVVLTLGSSSYGPSTNNAYAPTAILRSPTNFGPSGIVKVRSITVLNSNARGDALANFITSNKVDIIFNIIGYNFNDATMPVIQRFVNSGGVVIVGDENTAHSSTKTLINNFIAANPNNNMSANGDYTMINNVKNDASDPIINGPFGKLGGLKIGNDALNGWYYNNIPTDFTPLVYKENSTDVWGMRHKTKGFAFFGDGGWPMGTMKNSLTTIYPAMFNGSGYPVGKPYYGGAIVYNSVLYANVMAWAIEYVKVNKPK